MPIRTYIQDTQTLIPTPHSLQQNNCFICEHKDLLLGWSEAVAKTLRRLWHQPWCLQGMANTDYGAGAKWCGTEGYLPSVSAQERRYKFVFPFLPSQKKKSKQWGAFTIFSPVEQRQRSLGQPDTWQRNPMGLGSYPFFCQLMLMGAGGARKPSKTAKQAKQVEDETKWNIGTSKKLWNINTQGIPMAATVILTWLEGTLGQIREL